MNPQAMYSFGRAMLAYFEGDAAAELIIRRDDGQEHPVPVRVFFREQTEFTPIDQAAIERCTGRILDVGAGTGLHSLVLQRKGLSVTAIDISCDAVTVMRQRGVADVRCADVLDFQGQSFDTVIMLGHGIGMVETIAGLDRFLVQAHGLLSENGQILLHSLDVRSTDDPASLAYHDTNRQAGRYFGEIRLQVEFQGERGPYCGWLQVDAETLNEHAKPTGWQCEIIRREENGDYLARLSQHRSA